MNRPKSRASSAVLLVRGEGPNLEVFLVERAPELRFFGGYWALPGGVRGPEDGEDGPNGDDTDPLRRCAVREMFEETGVLLDPSLRSSLNPQKRESVRAALLDAERAQTASPWGELGADPACPELRNVCRIKTPPFTPVRYDTVFVLACLPEGENPTIIDGELVAGQWWRPEEALQSWRQGTIRIVPPVLILLEHLKRSASESKVLDHFVETMAATADGYANGRLHQVRFSPGIVLAPVATPTLPPATTTNCLLIGEERLWILDPATPDESEQERLFALIEELCAEGRELGGIAVTHHHPDHVGAVVATSKRFDLGVRAHPKTLERLPSGFKPGEPMRDGDRISLGRSPDGQEGWELIAQFTPGHDQGHLAFRESRYHSVLVGDMLSTVSTIVIDPPEGHLRTYLQSLEKLLAEPMDVLYPSHGPAAPDGHRLVRRYLRHRAQRETALLKAVQESPGTAKDFVPTVYWDTDKRLYGLAERSLVAGLEKLEEDGKVRRLDGDRFEVTETGSQEVT
ncbi:MAG: MBL fold metallo-hydrolase [Planctomycetota bacterium]